MRNNYRNRKHFIQTCVVINRDADITPQTCSGHLTPQSPKYFRVMEGNLTAYLDEEVTPIWEILREI